jgi:hypothetical protein
MKIVLFRRPYSCRARVSTFWRRKRLELGDKEGSGNPAQLERSRHAQHIGFEIADGVIARVRIAERVTIIVGAGFEVGAILPDSSQVGPADKPPITNIIRTIGRTVAPVVASLRQTRLTSYVRRSLDRQSKRLYYFVSTVC